MGNNIAFAMIVFWPLLAIYLYSTRSIQVATVWVILGGFLILPVKTSIDLPMIPALGKDSIPVLSAVIGIFLVRNKRLYFTKGLGKAKYLVYLLILVPFISAWLNSDSIQVGRLFLKGLSLYDGLALMMNSLVPITPFFIGRQFFKTYDHQLLMFKFLVVAGLIYSIPMLFEARISPQLHIWVYDYFPHDFGQQIRFGGFRPVVFIGHGLEVAFFTSIVLISSVALWLNAVRGSVLPAIIRTGYIFIILLLCKSVASIFYGTFSFIALRFLSTSRVALIAIVISTLAFLYPILSISNLFPHQEIIELAESFDKERAQSLAFRFDNESILLRHAQDKPYFGWGGWGRNRVYDVSGRDITVTDGVWIIQFGQNGWAGFISLFGLMFLTVIGAYITIKSIREQQEKNLMAAHMLIVAIIMIDQIPNSSLAPWLWLIIGSLHGRCSMVNSKK